MTIRLLSGAEILDAKYMEYKPPLFDRDKVYAITEVEGPIDLLKLKQIAEL